MLCAMEAVLAAAAERPPSNEERRPGLRSVTRRFKAKLRLRSKALQLTMRTVCLNRTQLMGAGVLNLDHRPHAAVAIALALALALLSQQHALRGAGLPPTVLLPQTPPPAACV